VTVFPCPETIIPTGYGPRLALTLREDTWIVSQENLRRIKTRSYDLGIETKGSHYRDRGQARDASHGKYDAQP